jgi:hypothetical protein
MKSRAKASVKKSAPRATAAKKKKARTKK